MLWASAGPGVEPKVKITVSVLRSLISFNDSIGVYCVCLVVDTSYVSLLLVPAQVGQIRVRKKGPVAWLAGTGHRIMTDSEDLSFVVGRCKASAEALLWDLALRVRRPCCASSLGPSQCDSGNYSHLVMLVRKHRRTRSLPAWGRRPQAGTLVTRHAVLRWIKTSKVIRPPFALGNTKAYSRSCVGAPERCPMGS